MSDLQKQLADWKAKAEAAPRGPAAHIATFHPARVLRLLAVVECANDYINTSYSLEGRAMQIERMRNALAALTEDHPNDQE